MQKILINHQSYNSQHLFNELKGYSLYSISSDQNILQPRTDYSNNFVTHKVIKGIPHRLDYGTEIKKYYSDNNIDLFFPLYNDMLLPYIYEICNLTHIQKDILCSKHKYLAHFKKAGIPVPSTTCYWPSIKYPCIAKPDNGTGGIGVKYIKDYDELKNFITDDIQHIDLGQGYTFQEYIEGTLVSVAGRVINGETVVDCIYDIESSDLPYRAEIGFTYPSNVDIQDQIKDYCKQAIDSLGLKNNIWMADFIVSDDAYIIDFSPRLSVSVSKIVNSLSDVPYSHFVVDALQGIYKPLELQNESIVYRHFPINKGLYKHKQPLLPNSCVEFVAPEEKVYMDRFDLQVGIKGYAVCKGKSIEQCNVDWNSIKEQLV